MRFPFKREGELDAALVGPMPKEILGIQLALDDAEQCELHRDQDGGFSRTDIAGEQNGTLGKFNRTADVAANVLELNTNDAHLTPRIRTVCGVNKVLAHR